MIWRDVYIVKIVEYQMNSNVSGSNCLSLTRQGCPGRYASTRMSRPGSSSSLRCTGYSISDSLLVVSWSVHRPMIAAGYPMNLPGFPESEDDPKVRVTNGKRSKVLVEYIHLV